MKKKCKLKKIRKNHFGQWSVDGLVGISKTFLKKLFLTVY